MTHEHLLVETHGAVRTLTLNNPERRNVQTPSLWAALAAEAKAVPDDVRVVVLRGAGPSLSAGINLAMFTPDGVAGEGSMVDVVAGGPESIERTIATYQEAFVPWRSCHAIVVAAVQGHAIGGGFQLALAADLRVVADDVSFVMKEPQLGIIPDLGGTKALVDLVGYARALEICATGRSVGADEAARLGLANVVASAADLEAATAALVEQLLAVPHAALRALKPLLLAAGDNSIDGQAELERQTQVPLLIGRLGTSR